MPSGHIDRLVETEVALDLVCTGSGRNCQMLRLLDLTFSCGRIIEIEFSASLSEIGGSAILVTGERICTLARHFGVQFVVAWTGDLGRTAEYSIIETASTSGNYNASTALVPRIKDKTIFALRCKLTVIGTGARDKFCDILERTVIRSFRAKRVFGWRFLCLFTLYDILAWTWH